MLTWDFAVAGGFPGHHASGFNVKQTWLDCSPTGPGNSARARKHAERSRFEFAGGARAFKRLALLPFPAAWTGGLQLPSVAFFGQGLQTRAGKSLIGDMMWSPRSGFAVKTGGMNPMQQQQPQRNGVKLKLDRSFHQDKVRPPQNQNPRRMQQQQQQQQLQLQLPNSIYQNQHELPSSMDMVAMYGRDRHLINRPISPGAVPVRNKPGAWARSITATSQGRDRLAAIDALVFIVDALELADCVPLVHAEETRDTTTADDGVAVGVLADHRAELAEFLKHAKPGVPLLVLACSAGALPPAVPPHTGGRGALQPPPMVPAPPPPPAGAPVGAPAPDVANVLVPASATEIAKMFRLGAQSREWRVESLNGTSRESSEFEPLRQHVTRLEFPERVGVPLRRGVGWLLDAQVASDAAVQAKSKWPWQ